MRPVTRLHVQPRALDEVKSGERFVVNAYRRGGCDRDHHPPNTHILLWGREKKKKKKKSVVVVVVSGGGGGGDRRREHKKKRERIEYRICVRVHKKKREKRKREKRKLVTTLCVVRTH